jgi:hypothetical protein
MSQFESTLTLAASIVEADPSKLYLWMMLLCVLLAVLALGGAAAGVVRGARVRRRLRDLRRRGRQLCEPRMRDEVALPSPLRTSWWLEGGIVALALILPALTAVWVGGCRAAASSAFHGGDSAALALAAGRQLEALVAGCASVTLSLPFVGVALALALAGRSQARGLERVLALLRGGAAPDAPEVRAGIERPGLRGHQTLAVSLAVSELVLTPLLIGGALYGGGLIGLADAVATAHPVRAAAVLASGLAAPRALLDTCAAIALVGVVIAAGVAVLMLVVLSPARGRGGLAASRG